MRQKPVLEHRERALVLLGPVEELRIRDQRERPFLQPEMLGVDIEGTDHTHSDRTAAFLHPLWSSGATEAFPVRHIRSSEWYHAAFIQKVAMSRPQDPI
jgi:hypothetical protein